MKNIGSRIRLKSTMSCVHAPGAAFMLRWLNPMVRIFLLMALVTRVANVSSAARIALPSSRSYHATEALWRALPSPRWTALRGGQGDDPNMKCSCQFQLRIDKEIKDSESIILLGNRPELGQWKPDAVSPMSKLVLDGSVVYLQNVDLPAGQQVSYRYVIVNNGDRSNGNLKWEQLDRDRAMWLAPDGSTTLSCDKFNTRVPEFTTYGAAAEELWIQSDGKTARDMHIGKIEEVYFNSPASAGGLMDGDLIMSIGAVDYAYIQEHGISSIAEVLVQSEGKSLVITVRRDGGGPRKWKVKNLTIVPREWEGKGLLGCSLELAPALPGVDDCGPTYSVTQVTSFTTVPPSRSIVASPSSLPPASASTTPQPSGSIDRRISSAASFNTKFSKVPALKRAKSTLPRIPSSSSLSFSKASRLAHHNVISKAVIFTSFPLTLLLSTAWRASRPLTKPLLAATHTTSSLALGTIPLAIGPTYVAIRWSLIVCSKALAITCTPAARAVSLLSTIISSTSSFALWPASFLFSPPLHAFSSALAPSALLAMSTISNMIVGTVHLAAFLSLTVISLPFIIVSFIVRIINSAVTNFLRIPTIISLIIQAFTLIALMPVHAIYPLIRLPLSISLAIIHAPVALVAEVCAHPLAISSILTCFLFDKSMHLSAKALKPLTLPLTLPPLRLLAHFLIQTLPYTLIRTCAFTLPSTMTKGTSLALSLLSMTCNSLVFPIPRFIHHIMVARIVFLPCKISHAFISVALSTLPAILGACVGVAHRAEEACMQALHLVLDSARALLRLWGSDYYVFEWKRGGKLASGDAKEVALVGDFNSWGKTGPHVRLCRVIKAKRHAANVNGQTQSNEMNQPNGQNPSSNGGGWKQGGDALGATASRNVYRGGVRLSAGRHLVAFMVDGVRQCTAEWPLAVLGISGQPAYAANIIHVPFWRGVVKNTLLLPITVVTHVIPSVIMSVLKMALTTATSPFIIPARLGGALLKRPLEALAPVTSAVVSMMGHVLFIPSFLARNLARVVLYVLTLTRNGLLSTLTLAKNLVLLPVSIGARAVTGVAGGVSKGFSAVFRIGGGNANFEQQRAKSNEESAKSDGSAKSDKSVARTSSDVNVSRRGSHRKIEIVVKGGRAGAGGGADDATGREPLKLVSLL